MKESFRCPKCGAMVYGPRYYCGVCDKVVYLPSEKTGEKCEKCGNIVSGKQCQVCGNPAVSYN